MKQIKLLLASALLGGLLAAPASSFAQLGGKLRKAEKLINQAADKSKKAADNTQSNTKSTNQTGTLPADYNYTCPDKIKDLGFTSETHKKYSGKVVFSKTEITKTAHNESSFTSSFSISDNIYARLFLPESPTATDQSMGLCCKGVPYCSEVYIRYTIDGGKVLPGNEVNCTPDDKEWTTWQIGMSPTKEDVTSGYPRAEIGAFRNLMSGLSEGSHKIKVDIVMKIQDDVTSNGKTYSFRSKFGDEKILASGEFTLQVKNSDKKAMEDKLYIKPSEPKPMPAGNSSSSGSSSCSVTIRNGSNQGIHYELHSSGGSYSSNNYLSTNESPSFDCNEYVKIVVTDGSCKDQTYYLKGMGGQTLTICGKEK